MFLLLQKDKIFSVVKAAERIHGIAMAVPTCDWRSVLVDLFLISEEYARNCGAFSWMFFYRFVRAMKFIGSQ